jgi:hypothetical protein
MNILQMKLKQIVGFTADHYGMQNVLDTLANYTAALAEEHNELSGNHAYGSDEAKQHRFIADDWDECGRAISLCADEPRVKKYSEGAPMGMED